MIANSQFSRNSFAIPNQISYNQRFPCIINVASVIIFWLGSSKYSAAAASHTLEFAVSRCRTSTFATCFQPPQVRMWNDLSWTLNKLHHLEPSEPLDGFKCAVDRVFLSFQSCVFVCFQWRRCLWGCESNLLTILIFSLGPWQLVLRIIIYSRLIKNWIQMLLNFQCLQNTLKWCLYILIRDALKIVILGIRNIHIIVFLLLFTNISFHYIIQLWSILHITPAPLPPLRAPRVDVRTKWPQCFTWGCTGTAVQRIRVPTARSALAPADTWVRIAQQCKRIAQQFKRSVSVQQCKPSIHAGHTWYTGTYGEYRSTLNACLLSLVPAFYNEPATLSQLIKQIHL